MNARWLLPLSCVLLLGFGCSDDDNGDDGGDASRDATTGNDSSIEPDAGAEMDASTEDASAEDASTGTCPLSDDGRALLENVVAHYIESAGVVAFHARPREAAFVMPLVATGEKFHNFAFLIAECTEPTTYDAYCLSGGEPGEGFYAEHDLCTQLRCEADDIYLYDMWMTMRPNTSPNPHEFRYETTVPAGEGISSPNPRLTWRAVTSTDASVDVSAELDLALEVRTTGGATIFGDVTGSLSSSRRMVGEEDVVEVTVDLSFLRIADGGAVTVHGEVRDNDMISGEIRQGNAVLGSIVHQTNPDQGLLLVEWSGTCE